MHSREKLSRKSYTHAGFIQRHAGMWMPPHQKSPLIAKAMGLFGHVQEAFGTLVAVKLDSPILNMHLEVYKRCILDAPYNPRQDAEPESF